MLSSKDAARHGERRLHRIVVPTLDHAAGIAEVHNTGWREAYESLVPPHRYDDAARERRLAHWTRTLTEPEAGTELRIAVSNGTVIGFAMAGPTRDEDATRDWELWVIYVLAAWYGAGIAQDLLDATVGDRPAQLWVLRDNPRAQSFYRRNGFRPDGTEKVLPYLEGLVEIRMVR